MVTLKRIAVAVLLALVALNWGTTNRYFFAKPQPSEHAQRGEVVLYATSWCGYCQATRKLLARGGVKYREFDIEKSEEGAKLYRALGGRGVPLLEIGDQLIRGYDEKKILAALKG